MIASNTPFLPGSRLAAYLRDGSQARRVGLSDDGLVPRFFYTTAQDTGQQLSLFDAGAEYNLE